ncbi:MAG TPA: 1,2-phenylacetyl-CoA epoxidase subunit PaaE [Candidatus Dormibacteraeota bacterium]|nr:1,2-phenylacetyl-CoA epoxidase subunit PaaE [Candidatus Dormibacteraeota bacterium]
MDPVAPVAPPRRHAVLHELRVAAVEPLTEDSVTITFDVPDALRDAYDFVQGQHVSVRCRVAGDELRRNYSICTPAGSGVLRIAVKRLEGGAFSSYAHSRLRAGDVLEVMTPTGRFHTALDPARARHHAFIAAGSGITPVLSLLATTLEVEPRSRVTLLYGNRTTASIMFLEELCDLKNRHPARFHLVNVLSRERQESELLSGRLDPERLSRVLDALVDPAGVDEWFVCGPRAMIDGARVTLVARGVDAAHVHGELFHAGADPSPPLPPAATAEGTSRVTVVLDGRSSTFELAPGGERILDAALRVRGDAPFACRDGVCGTCRARVLEGAVTMDRNHALEPSEVDAGFVLACQSHPASPTVTLDFDA